MPPIVKEVSTPAEFSLVIDCLWEAYYDPYAPFMNVLYPVFSATEEGYATAVIESKSRLWSIHTGDPTSHWIYVTDESGKVFSGAHWNFYDVSPYFNGTPKLEAFWHPEGEGRVFASRVVNEVYGLRGKRMWRPHARTFTPPFSPNKAC
jgi:hypothetical protein